MSDDEYRIKQVGTIHIILQEEIADRVIYETYLGGEALRRGLRSAQSRLETFVISLLANHDAHHKDLRAKELGEIRERMPKLFRDETDYCTNCKEHNDVCNCNQYINHDDTIRTVLALLDELIEKPI
jgi:hypothetical protein